MAHIDKDLAIQVTETGRRVIDVCADQRVRSAAGQLAEDLGRAGRSAANVAVEVRRAWQQSA